MLPRKEKSVECLAVFLSVISSNFKIKIQIIMFYSESLLNSLA